MSDEHVTIMVVPESGSQVRKLVLPKRLLMVALIFVGVSIFAGVFILIHYADLLGQVAENKKLRVENRALELDLRRASGRLEALDQNVSRVRDFATKLRVLGNLGEPDAMRTLEAPDPKAGQNSGMPPDEDRGRISNPGEPEGRYQPPAEEEDSILNAAMPPDESSESPLELAVDRGSILGVDLSDIHSNDDLPEAVMALENLIDTLDGYTREFEKDLAQLLESLNDRVDQLIHTPSILPAKGPLTSRFGYRFNPFSGVKTFHAGLDIAGGYGRTIHAPANGLITFAGDLGGFGLVLIIDHGYNIVSKYGHNSAILVKKGDRVQRGQPIAKIGSSGRSTGPHLHYQVEVNGRPVNPLKFILDI